MYGKLGAPTTSTSSILWPILCRNSKSQFLKEPILNFFIRETPSSPSSHLRKIVQASLAESFWALGDIDRFSTHPVCNGQLNLTTLFMGIPNYITLRQLIFLQYIVLIKLTLEVKYFAKYINTLLQIKVHSFLCILILLSHVLLNDHASIYC